VTYIFIFISIIILFTILGSLFKHISSEKKFNPEYSSTVDQGRILNFETDESEVQQKPV